MRVAVGYPSAEEEREILARRRRQRRQDEAAGGARSSPATSFLGDAARARGRVRRRRREQYVVDLVQATRADHRVGARRLAARRAGAAEARARRRRAARARLRHARRREGDGGPALAHRADPPARALGVEAHGRPGRGRSAHAGAGPEDRGDAIDSRRLTPLALSVVTVAAARRARLVLGVLSGRAELVVAGAAAGPRPACRRPAPPAARLDAQHAVSSARALRGRARHGDAHGARRRAVPLLELFEPLPPTRGWCRAPTAGSSRSARGQNGEWTYEVEFPAPGRATLGAVHAARLGARRGCRATNRSGWPAMLRVYPRGDAAPAAAATAPDADLGRQLRVAARRRGARARRHPRVRAR